MFARARDRAGRRRPPDGAPGRRPAGRRAALVFVAHAGRVYEVAPGHAGRDRRRADRGAHGIAAGDERRGPRAASCSRPRPARAASARAAARPTEARARTRSSPGRCGTGSRWSRLARRRRSPACWPSARLPHRRVPRHHAGPGAGQHRGAGARRRWRSSASITAPSSRRSPAAGARRGALDLALRLLAGHATFADGTDLYRARQVVAERVAAAWTCPRRRAPALGPMATGLGEVFHYLVTGDGVPRRAAPSTTG
jgi:hypothetical protein